MAKSNARKTNLTGQSVDDYIDSLDSEQVRDDSVRRRPSGISVMCVRNTADEAATKNTQSLVGDMPAIPPV